MSGEILDPGEAYKDWHPPRQYNLEEAQREADTIKALKTFKSPDEVDYPVLEKTAEVMELVENIEFPDYDKIVNAPENNIAFTQEQLTVIREQATRLGEPEKCQMVVDRLKKEGVENSNILLFLENAINRHVLKPVLHRVEVFSEESKAIREALGVSIDNSDKPEKYFYHGTRRIIPKLNTEELQSFVDRGIDGTQGGGVSAFVGNKGLATTIIEYMGPYGQDMLRFPVDRLTSEGYKINYYDPEEDPFAIIQIPEGESLSPDDIEYRIDSLGIYVPLEKAIAVLEILDRINNSGMNAAEVPSIASISKH